MVSNLGLSSRYAGPRSHAGAPVLQICKGVRHFDLEEICEAQSGERGDVDHRETIPCKIRLPAQDVVQIVQAGNPALEASLAPFAVLVELDLFTQSRCGVMKVGP